MSGNPPSKGYQYAFSADAREDFIAIDKARPISSGTAARALEADRQRIAAEIAEFEARGGRIQKLGNTPIHKSRSVRTATSERYLQQRAKGRAAQGKHARKDSE